MYSMLEFSGDWTMLVLLSRVLAAFIKIGARFCSECPLSTNLSINFTRIFSKSSGEFCSQYLLTSPDINPFKQLGGCADLGGMYK